MIERKNRLVTKSKIFNHYFSPQWAIGISDGLILPFAIATGICTATQNNNQVIFITITVMCGAAIFLGLGGYFAEKTEQQLFSTINNAEASKSNNSEYNDFEKNRRILESIDLDKDIQEQAANEISDEHNRLAALINNNSLPLKLTDANQPLRSALQIVLSYLAGGMVPIIPYFITQDAHLAFRYSVMITLICLFLFGYIKTVASSMHPVIGGLRMAGIGAIASGVAFAIAIAIGKV